MSNLPYLVCAYIVFWALTFALHLLFGIGRPSGMDLILAVPRGALFGLIVALFLRAHWNRERRKASPDG